jgi:hypothetical protein
LQIIVETEQKTVCHHDCGALWVGVIGGTNGLSAKDTKSLVKFARRLAFVSLSLTNAVEVFHRGGNEVRLGRVLWTVGVQFGFEEEKGLIKISI